MAVDCHSDRLDRERAIAYAIEQPAKWKSTRSSSGPRRKTSNVERKECIATIKEYEKHCEHWCISSHKRN
jgi:hypothetical protein